MTRLQAHKLSLAYGPSPVVQDINVLIPDGQVTSIIGPNGCGKSTLLRALSRLMKPRGGAVTLDGQAIHSRSTKAVARELGLLPQGASAPEAVLVEDLVSRGRYPHQSFFQPPTSKDRDAIERALTLANVQDLRRRPIDELSGGQRQRAWIAMALAQETPILLLDEPTTYLDISHQNDVLELVRRLNEEEGKTVVMVLHDVNEAARASHHVIAMREGRVVATGSPSEVVTTSLLESVFGVSSDVVLHPQTGQPVCVPRSRADSKASTEPEEPRLVTRDLQLAYGKRIVTRDINVSFPTGAITCIVGPNACGKSTLLRAAARLLDPKTGSVLLDSQPVQQGARRNFARELSLLTQAPVAPPDVTVEELVAAGRFPHQRWWRQWSRTDQEAIDAALEATGMTELRHRHIESLSGGQRQRAWVAMNLAQDTPIVVLDEPTTFLDIAHQVEVLDLVHRLNRERGRTTVMVLHDLHQACRYADHLVAMKDGEIIASGPPAQIMTPELVEQVFGYSAVVVPDPVSGSPLILPAVANPPALETVIESSTALSREPGQLLTARP